MQIKSGADGSAPCLPPRQQWAQDNMAFLNKKRIKRVPYRSGQDLEQNLRARIEKSEQRFHSGKSSRPKPAATITSSSEMPKEDDPFQTQLSALHEKVIK